MMQYPPPPGIAGAEGGSPGRSGGHPTPRSTDEIGIQSEVGNAKRAAQQEIHDATARMNEAKARLRASVDAAQAEVDAWMDSQNADLDARRAQLERTRQGVADAVQAHKLARAQEILQWEEQLDRYTEEITRAGTYTENPVYEGWRPGTQNQQN